MDVSAGPIVYSTDLDYHNIHNTIPYEFSYGSHLVFLMFLDRVVKMDSIALDVSYILENVFFTNIVNITHFDSQNQLLIPIVFFTDADLYSTHVSFLQQEVEEIKMKIKQIFKTYLRMRRAHFVTEMIYLRNNISLLNSIQSSFIDSITLLNSNNSVSYKTYRRIVGFRSVY